VDYIFKKFRKDIDAMFLKRGYRLFGLIDTGFLYLFTKNKVSSAEDIKKQKLLTWMGEIEKATLDELGAKYTPLTVPEIAASFKTGLIDAGIAPHIWMLVTEVFLYTHYFIDTPFFYSTVAIFMDEKQIREMEKSYPPGFIKEIINRVRPSVTACGR
jgi:TRAP-type C4-dicarboxylate transport system substrate-binding protein